MVPVTAGPPSFALAPGGGGPSYAGATQNVSFSSGSFVTGSQGVASASGVPSVGMSLQPYMPYLLLGAAFLLWHRKGR